eukprot:gene26453-28980_t
MSTLQIHQFPCRSDNFGVLVHDPVSGATAAIDAPDEASIVAALAETGWKLSDIFVTHHHLDHVEGLPGLKRAYGVRVVAPRAEADKIADVDVTVGEGDAMSFGGHAVEVIETPGHTLGHIAYVIPDQAVAFVGDTLFSLGCGRVFEGTPGQMSASLQKLAALPEETAIYCGHEYTLANGRFALTVDGDNGHLRARMIEVQALLAEGKPTLPTTIGAERLTNPFLRTSDPAIKAGLGMSAASDVEVFARLRQMKNDFRG